MHWTVQATGLQFQSHHPQIRLLIALGLLRALLAPAAETPLCRGASLRRVDCQLSMREQAVNGSAEEGAQTHPDQAALEREALGRRARGACRPAEHRP